MSRHRQRRSCKTSFRFSSFQFLVPHICLQLADVGPFRILPMSIAENLAQIHQRIERAARRAGRQASDVMLMAVSKTFPVESIVEAYEAGQRVFGENRVQEFADKIDGVRQLRNAEWHLIGHLQSNKSARAAELFGWVDSADSLRLLRRLDEAAARLNRILDVLIEVNVGGEEQKQGVAPCSHEFENMLREVPALEHVRLRGLMTVPPYTEDPKDARPYFRMLRQVRREILGRALPQVSMDVLSMGMSHDFEVAIEEGSTCVRVGTAIFGKRTPL
jgi:pyridoxal phosphate enzyme (YggS family)